MAIFASTTTTGYSDPLKALTIKALEKRQADMLAQQATQEAGMFKPENTQTPIQGIGQVANVLADKFNQSRTDAAIAAQRDALSKAMTGYDPLGGPPPPAAAAIDPELYKSLLTQWAETRRNAATNTTTARGQDLQLQGTQGTNAVTREGQQLTATGVREGHQVTREGQAATAEGVKEGHNIQRAGQQLQLDLADKAALARREEAIAQRDWETAENRRKNTDTRGNIELKAQLDDETEKARQKFELAKQNSAQAFQASQPKSDVGAVAHDVNAGIVKPETGEAAQRKLTQPAPGVVKATTDATTSYREHAQSVDQLEYAQSLLKKGINTGPWAGTKTSAMLGAEGLPLVGRFVGKEDADKARRTTDFNSIVNFDTIKQMSQTLKGQDSNYEMQKFLEVLNNPSASPELRQMRLNKLITAAKIDRDRQAQALKELGSGGEVQGIDEAIAKGRSGGGGGGGAGGVVENITEAEALKLDRGTRYKLKDGRTGVVE